MPEIFVDELHRTLAKLSDSSDAPHGIPAPCAIDLRRPVSMAYGMRDYQEGFRHMQDRAAERSGETDGAAFVCRKKDTEIFQWELNGWPLAHYVSIMAEYECSSDEAKPTIRRRWIERKSLTKQKLDLILDSWALRYGATSAEAEIAAQENLLKRLNEKQRRSYILSSAFVEESKRSGVAYLLRKGLPTLAFGKDNILLCALCLHSFGAFVRSYVGLMPPSDEVLAHLLLIRGDEHRYWKKSGQHPAWEPRSGV